MSVIFSFICFSVFTIMIHAEYCTRFDTETGTCYIDLSEKWIPSDHDITCDPEYPNCIVTCSNEYSCGSVDQDFFPRIFFPESGNRCTLNCNSTLSCNLNKIFSGNCSTVDININHKNQSNMDIYAPNDNGILNIYLLSTISSFTHNNIYSSLTTSEININCDIGDNCNHNDIYCPESIESECNIYCTNSCNYMNIYTQNLNNLNIDCDEYNDNVCDNIIIQCDDGTQSYMDYDNDGNNWLIDGECKGGDEETDKSTLLPTRYPTHSPTEQVSLSIYIYYNETKVPNITLFAHLMHESLLETYTEITGNSYNYYDYDEYFDEEFKYGGIIDMIFCVVFNTNICSSDIDFDINTQNPSDHNSQFVSMANFNLIANQNIDHFEDYVIDKITRYQFKHNFDHNMNAKLLQYNINDDFIPNAIYIDPIYNNNNDNHNYNISSSRYTSSPIISDNNVSSTESSPAHIIIILLISGILGGIICTMLCGYAIHRYTNSGFIAKLEKDLEEQDRKKKQKQKEKQQKQLQLNNKKQNQNQNQIKNKDIVYLHNDIDDNGSLNKLHSVLSAKTANNNNNTHQCTHQQFMNGSIDVDEIDIDKFDKELHLTHGRGRSLHWGFTNNNDGEHLNNNNNNIKFPKRQSYLSAKSRPSASGGTIIIHKNQSRTVTDNDIEIENALTEDITNNNNNKSSSSIDTTFLFDDGANMNNSDASVMTMSGASPSSNGSIQINNNNNKDDRSETFSPRMGLKVSSAYANFNVHGNGVSSASGLSNVSSQSSMKHIKCISADYNMNQRRKQASNSSLEIEDLFGNPGPSSVERSFKSTEEGKGNNITNLKTTGHQSMITYDVKLPSHQHSKTMPAFSGGVTLNLLNSTHHSNPVKIVHDDNKKNDQSVTQEESSIVPMDDDFDDFDVKHAKLNLSSSGSGLISVSSEEDESDDVYTADTDTKSKNSNNDSNDDDDDDDNLLNGDDIVPKPLKNVLSVDTTSSDDSLLDDFVASPGVQQLSFTNMTSIIQQMKKKAKQRKSIDKHVHVQQNKISNMEKNDNNMHLKITRPCRNYSDASQSQHADLTPDLPSSPENNNFDINDILLNNNNNNKLNTKKYLHQSPSAGEHSDIGSLTPSVHSLPSIPKGNILPTSMHQVSFKIPSGCLVDVVDNNIKNENDIQPINYSLQPISPTPSLHCSIKSGSGTLILSKALSNGSEQSTKSGLTDMTLATIQTNKQSISQAISKNYWEENM